jgi:hypothetical protein
VVFLDQKKLWVVPKASKVWCDIRTDEILVVDPRVHRMKPVKLCFYLVVNALVGLVDVIFVTGTTGEPQRRYSQVCNYMYSGVIHT